jgi:hypothetical protein
LINVININVLPLAEILNWWYTFCLNKYSSSLQNTFNSSFDNLSFIQFVVFLKEQYKLLEDERVYHFLYNKIVNGIFPINYEIQ